MTGPWAPSLVDKSTIIINALTNRAGGRVGPPRERKRPVVSGCCLVRRKGRARFPSSLGSSGNQYSCGFELIQRWERWGTTLVLRTLRPLEGNPVLRWLPS